MSKYAQIEAPTVSTQPKALETIPSESMESVEELKGTSSKSKETTFKSKETSSKSKDATSKLKKQQDDGRHTRPAQSSVIRRTGLDV